MKNLCFLTYTHTNCKDIWNSYFGRLDKYASGIPSYVIVNKILDQTKKYNNHFFLEYAEDHPYFLQWVNALTSIPYDYFIYMQEDFILYDYINLKELDRYLQFLEQSKDLSYVRLIKCGDVTEIKKENNLFLVSESGKLNKSINSYSMQPTIWKKNDFIKLYMAVQNKDHIENFNYTQQMNNLNINGVYYYSQEPRRGGHYDSSVFPYIATAVVRGKWNVSEYSKELDSVFKEFKIDKTQRGER